MKFTDFTDDEEKMKDFLILDKKRFLEMYSYLTEEEYNLTKNKLNKKKQIGGGMKRKCINWAIVTTMERPDGTWFTDTITEVDKETSTAVDEFLTKYVEDEEGEE